MPRRDAIHRPPTSQGRERTYAAKLTVPNRVESVRPAVMFIVRTARLWQVRAAGHPLFEVAVAEAMTNAVKHGKRGALPDNIDCELELADGEFVLGVIDNGPGFEPAHPPRPAQLTADVDAIPETGHGLQIIQSVFPRVDAARRQGRFALQLSVPA